MAEGFRIKESWDRVNPDLIARAAKLPVSNISDVMSRHIGAPASMRPRHRQGVLSGPALTVSVRPGDNLMLHKALIMAQPGDVIVVDAGGALDNAIMGELMLARGVVSKIAGVAIWGAIRDLDSICKQDVPVFSSGISHRGPYKDGPGEIGFPIALGNMTVNPGDLIVGDWDGLVCLPKDSAAEILNRADKKHAGEERQYQTTIEGKYNGDWIDKNLKELGCEFIA
nr:RraA family protein [uncultured Cohaesibacter sp.]